MVLQLTISSDLDKSQTGPTLVHSTGVLHYKIPPEIIRILQENFSNDRLADHEQGVLCQVGPQSVLSALRQNGFTLQKQTTATDKALWTLVQGGGSSGGDDHPQPVPPPEPQPTPGDENDENAGGDDQGGDNADENNEGEGEGEGEGGEEGGEEEEEPEEE